MGDMVVVVVSLEVLSPLLCLNRSRLALKAAAEAADDAVAAVSISSTSS